MPTVSTFLPKDYELKESGSDFFKFEEGDNKLRVLTPATIGLEGWTPENKPFRRSGPGAKIDPSEVALDYKYDENGKPKISEFWAFYVYSYAQEKVMILSLTQATIKKGIAAFANDADWGSPEGYDLVITKTTAGKTSYAVRPSPAKPLTKAVQATVDEARPSFDIVKALGIEMS